mmetsp:Transcript_11153/g.25573  ORF Transcript_11153/g.25573 Transcript_11153/m.25573 type:complete len:103 (-) Transcript_11153:24-332(-)
MRPSADACCAFMSQLLLAVMLLFGLIFIGTRIEDLKKEVCKQHATVGTSAFGGGVFGSIFVGALQECLLGIAVMWEKCKTAVAHRGAAFVAGTVVGCVCRLG